MIRIRKGDPESRRQFRDGIPAFWRAPVRILGHDRRIVPRGLQKSRHGAIAAVLGSFQTSKLRGSVGLSSEPRSERTIRETVLPLAPIDRLHTRLWAASFPRTRTSRGRTRGIGISCILIIPLFISPLPYRVGCCVCLTVRCRFAASLDRPHIQHTTILPYIR